MNDHQEEGKVKIVATTLRVVLYLLVAMLVCLAVINLCSTDAVIVSATEPGLTNLIDFDFNENVAEVATAHSDSILIYANAFYMPEDFASGSVEVKGNLYGTKGASLGEYGTLHMVLKLPLNQVYAITGKNVSYAQRLFIDGKEYTSIGVTGDNVDIVTPKTVRYIEGFMPNDEITEFVIHYSNFVHSDGGGLYPLQVGLVRNVVRNEQLKNFLNTTVVIALLTAAFLFFCLFLFFSKGSYLLWFALICICIAIRSLFTSDKLIMLLIPNLEWYLAIRLEYIFTLSIGVFSVLYVNSLFPKIVNRCIIRSFVIFYSILVLIICLTEPIFFTRFTNLMLGTLVVFAVCIILINLLPLLRKKISPSLSKLEQILLFAGLLIYMIFCVISVYGFDSSLSFFGLDYSQAGIIIFLFVNMLVLVMGCSRSFFKFLPQILLVPFGAFNLNI